VKEYPAHPVHVSSFRLARFPVTNRQYRLFCEATGHRPPRSLVIGLPDDHPVWGVDAGSIEGFLAWARESTGTAVRLPTEAEWEWAARGPARRQYPFGDEFDARLCNTREAGHGLTTSVMAHERYPSPFGICDMAGNVEEWTASDYAEYPGGDFIEDHLTSALGLRYPVLRGGSAELGGDLARGARRHGPHPQFTMFGFRVAVSRLALA
jgi:formylglycine-generating enzyme required for sulfatase activity